ncbi:MAG: hypothetical protein Q8M99_05380 [Methylotenera sp.]|nr:hypothetical protein [Methylotenera sp.]
MNQANRMIDEARNKLEIFYKNKYGANAASSLANGLIELEDIATNSDIKEEELSLIKNIKERVSQTILSEADRLGNVLPLARREDLEYWLEIMLIPRDAGWELSKEYIQAVKELKRVLNINKNNNGHISKETRFILFELDASDM